MGGNELARTRRDFAKWSMVALGSAALPDWMRGDQIAGGTADVAGPNSLRAHAEARGMLYGTAVVPQLLDVDGLAAGASTDGYMLLIKNQANILVAENAMKWGALRPSPAV